MSRKRITEIFPALLPVRIWQKSFFNIKKMELDSNTYANEFRKDLDYEISSIKSLMINEETGYDIEYQYNKVHNLKLISKTMNKLIIKPNDIFSFCYASRNAKHHGKYKDGLVTVNGETIHQSGGGVCHLSNELYHLFLKSPLTIIERHQHKVKAFPDPNPHSLEGIDATISCGWKDLKIQNNTNKTFQISIDFIGDYMNVRLLCDDKPTVYYNITNENKQYYTENNKVYESVSLIKEVIDTKTNELLFKTKLYDETVEIGYKLAEHLYVQEEL